MHAHSCSPYSIKLFKQTFFTQPVNITCAHVIIISIIVVVCSSNGSSSSSHSVLHNEVKTLIIKTNIRTKQLLIKQLLDGKHDEFSNETMVWKTHHRIASHRRCCSDAICVERRWKRIKPTRWHQTKYWFYYVAYLTYIICICALCLHFMVWWFEFSNIIWLMVRCNQQKPHLMNYLPAKYGVYFCLLFLPSGRKEEHFWTVFFSLARNFTTFSLRIKISAY